MVIDKVSSGYSAKIFQKDRFNEALHGTVTVIPQPGESSTYLR
jgi:hypothetical protein